MYPPTPSPLRRRTLALVAVFVAASVARAPAVLAEAPVTVRASVATSGAQGNDPSYDPHVSADGRLVAFVSDATGLVPGDTNGSTDIFVRDRVAGTTSRVSVSSSGQQGNGDSGTDPILSADGHIVAFPSDASNLVPGDTNGVRDLFVRDLSTGTTTRVSVSSGGGQGNRASFDAYVSLDGRYVTFSSQASNLVAGDTNGRTDVFVHDRVAGITTRVSVASSGAQANGSSEDAVVSDDGRYVAFSSLATNLVAGDTNGERDTFVHDVVTGVTRRVSLSSSGTQGNGESGYNPAISGDGRFVAFNSTSSNHVAGDTNGKRDVFVYELSTGAVSRVSVSTAAGQANGTSSSAPSLSRDGRYVAFLSSASNLVPGDTNGDSDVFLRDRTEGTTVRVSVTGSGEQSDGGSCHSQPYVNQLATLVVFTCGATNLVPGDTNGEYDVFVRTLGTAPPATTEPPPTEPPPTEPPTDDEPPPPELGTEITFTALADTTVREDRPTTNFGAATVVGVDASPLKRALLQFDVQGIGSGTVSSARLRLYVVDTSTGGGSFHAVAGPWSEHDVTWQTAPDVTGSPVASLGGVTAGHWVEVDVTSLVAGDGTVDVGITSGSTNGADYASREQAAFAPQLVVVAGSGGAGSAEPPDETAPPSAEPPTDGTEPPPPEPGTELTFTALADTTVREDRPTTNFGAATVVGVDASPLKRALLQFDVQGIGSGTVSSARLRLYVVDTSTGGGSFHAVAGPWSEHDVTWQTAPDVTGSPVASLGGVTAGHWVEVDVTSLVAGDGTVDVGITSGSTNGADYASREQAAFAPQLVVVAGP